MAQILPWTSKCHKYQISANMQWMSKRHKFCHSFLHKIENASRLKNATNFKPPLISKCRFFLILSYLFLQLSSFYTSFFKYLKSNFFLLFHQTGLGSSELVYTKSWFLSQWASFVFSKWLSLYNEALCVSGFIRLFNISIDVICGSSCFMLCP